jgi:hypothetical protein
MPILIRVEAFVAMRDRIAEIDRLCRPPRQLSRL